MTRDAPQRGEAAGLAAGPCRSQRTSMAGRHRPPAPLGSLARFARIGRPAAPATGSIVPGRQKARLERKHGGFIRGMEIDRVSTTAIRSRTHGQKPEGTPGLQTQGPCQDLPGFAQSYSLGLRCVAGMAERPDWLATQRNDGYTTVRGGALGTGLAVCGIPPHVRPASMLAGSNGWLRPLPRHHGDHGSGKRPPW